MNPRPRGGQRREREPRGEEGLVSRYLANGGTETTLTIFDRSGGEKFIARALEIGWGRHGEVRDRGAQSGKLAISLSISSRVLT